MSQRANDNHLYRLLQKDLITMKEYNEMMRESDRYWDEIRADADYSDDSYDSDGGDSE